MGRIYVGWKLRVDGDGDGDVGEIDGAFVFAHRILDLPQQMD